MKKTITTELLTFDELTQEQQEKCISEHRYFLTEDMDVEECLAYALEKEPIHGTLELGNRPWNYEIGGPGEYVGFNAVVPYGKASEFLEALGITPPSFADMLEIEIAFHHYYHTFSVNVSNVGERDLTDEEAKELEDLHPAVELALWKLANSLLKAVKEEIDYLESDDVISECFLVNEYFFHPETLKIHA